MLTFQQLKDNYSKTEKVFPKSFLVEYLQCELLDSIYKQEESKYLSFIGGTAIRLVYGGNRFSEDLDFDNFGLSFSDFEKLSGKIASDMKIKGFTVEFRSVEKGAYHCYIKFPHILRDSGLSDVSSEKILVRIDAAKREKFFKPEIFALNKFDIYRNILSNPIGIIHSQKLITALERKREKGRDFYDISYLYSLTQPDFGYIEKILGIKKEEFAQKLLKKCEKLDFNVLAKDVEPFLIYPDQSNRVAEFKKFIENKFEFMK